MKVPGLAWMASVVFVAMLVAVPSLAAEPPQGEQSFLNSAYQYRLQRLSGVWSLQISDGRGKSVTHDLDGCHFCALPADCRPGEDCDTDNCALDGIFQITTVSPPAVGVVCHAGAHGQRLGLFQGLKKRPVRAIKSHHVLELNGLADGIRIAFDRPDEAGGGAMHEESYPPGTGKRKTAFAPMTAEQHAVELTREGVALLGAIHHIAVGRDATALHRVLHEDVVTSGFGAEGRAAFEKRWQSRDTGSSMWPQLAALLRTLPRSVTTPAGNAALVFPAWAQQDIPGIEDDTRYPPPRGAALYLSPEAHAPQITWLAEEALRVPKKQSTPGWVYVGLADGRWGWVRDEGLRDPWGPRLVLEYIGDQWWITVLTLP